MPLPAASTRQADPYLLRDPDFVAAAQSAVDMVYNLEFTGARRLMAPWKQAHPDHPVWPFWEALELWWTILPDLENTSTDELFINKLREADFRSDRLLNRDRRHVDALVIKALANGFLARLYSNRESWYQSLSHARVSLNVLFRLEQLEPDLPDLQFGMGTYNYFAAYLAEEYPLVKPLAWMLPGGDREDGLNRLRMAADSSAFVIPESTYFLGHINLNYEQQYDLALHYLQTLTDRYPANGFFRRLRMRAYVNVGDLNRAAILIDSTLSDPDFSTDLPLQEEMNAVRARIAYMHLQNDLALEKSEKALSYSARLARNPNERRFGAMATWYSARAHLRSGHTDEGKRYLRELNSRRNHSFYAGRARELLREL
ncbi:MAG: hypothetical protein LC662_12010 [Rhodothermaceae bacterium]|nr:hypothetical protein [Rhodothermaceae bacterium]